MTSRNATVNIFSPWNLKDLVKLWMDYNIGLGMIYLADSLPESMKQLGEDALRGDYDSRRLAFEIAGLMGRNKAPIVAIQQNFGVNLEDKVSEVGEILMEPDP
jgi:hypothetical protein